MLFNSLEFLLFLPVVFLLYWFVFQRHLQWQNTLVLLASYFFYGWWSWQFLGLLMISTLLDFCYGFGVASLDRRKARIFLWLSIVNNLGILGVFKYYNFFADQFAAGMSFMGLQASPWILNVALPVGISFYTFHGMSYVFDIYRGSIRPVRDLLDYGVFVSFFPLLVAGPIERAHHLLPQIQQTRSFDYAQATSGARLILWGFFKKVVVADSLAPMVDQIFTNYQEQNAITLALGAIAFSFQIYGDFSGYSDIALGTARLFGIELLSNFKFPYFSRDIAEFWRRWHVSLSSWFKDYLYIPLGGSRNGKALAVRNTFIIFLVSGFWHGASWNFLGWGFIHACAFMPLLLLDRNRTFAGDIAASGGGWLTWRELFSMMATFSFVTLAWIFFRSESLGEAFGYVHRLFMNAIEEPGQFLHPWYIYRWPALFLILPLLVMDWMMRRDERQVLQFLPGKMARGALYGVLGYAVLFTWIQRAGDHPAQFIYFAF